METFKETFADKSTTISKLNFSGSTFAYTVFNKQNKQNKMQVHKKF